MTEQSYGHTYTLYFKIEKTGNHVLVPDPSELRWTKEEQKIIEYFSLAIDKVAESMGLTKVVTINDNSRVVEYNSADLSLLKIFYEKYREISSKSNFNEKVRSKNFNISVTHELYRNKYKLLETLYSSS